MLNMQNVKDIEIPEGDVRTIHDKDNRLIWGRLAYDTKYAGDTYQQTYSGKNLIDFATINFAGANDGSGTRSGSTYTVTASSDSTYSGIQFTQGSNLNLKPDTTYTFSATVQSTENPNGSMVFIIGAYTVGGSNIAGNFAKAGERSVATFTTPSSIPNNASIRLYPRAIDATAVFTDIMVEESATATSYEPYVGGIPAPNPDYPQAVQVVTGEQTVTISDGDTSQTYSISLTGKNLFDKSTVALGKNWNGEVGTTCYPYQTQATRSVVLVPAKPNTTYNLSLLESDWYVMQVLEADSSYEVLNVYSGQFNQGTKEVTTSATTAYIGVKFKYGSAGTTTMVESLLTELKLQLEVGSPTAYAPYYNYELCKIGDYQDYIYKSGDDWYVHKVTNDKVFSGEQDENWQIRNSGTANFYYTAPIVGGPTGQNTSTLYSNYGIGGDIRDATTTSGIMIVSTGTYVRLRYGTEMTLADWNTKLSSTNMTLYYPLATATDTKITDAILISQLDAVHEWLTRYGYSSTVTGNLPIIINQTNL